MEILWLISCIFSFFSIDPPCDASIEPDNGRHSYKRRTGDERCEGTIKRYRSGNLISLVSFSQGPISYNMSVGDLLLVKAPKTVYHFPLNVSGLNFGMNSIITYRLNMTINENQERKIPLGDVIIPLVIKPQNLGLLGYVFVGNKKVFIPVSTRPANVVGLNKSTSKPYSIKLLTTATLKEVAWAIATPDHDKRTYTKLDKPVTRDNAFELVITQTKVGSSGHVLYVKTTDDKGAKNISVFDIYFPG